MLCNWLKWKVKWNFSRNVEGGIGITNQRKQFFTQHLMGIRYSASQDVAEFKNLTKFKGEKHELSIKGVHCLFKAVHSKKQIRSILAHNFSLRILIYVFKGDLLY